VSTVIVSHELIWHITEALVASGAVAPPPRDSPTALLFLLCPGVSGR
jgi:hypothetical protein